MIKIEDGRKQFYQWDLGQRLLIEGYAPGTEVHFAGRRNGSLVNLNNDEQMALIVKAYAENDKVYANVPNILLQNAGELCVFIYLKTDDTAHTAERKVINVVPRAKTVDYIYTETEIKRWDDVAHSADEAITAAWEAANRASAAVNAANEAAGDARYAAQSAASAASNASAAITSATNAAIAANEALANLDLGLRGEPGYTPVRGTDYWTDEDIEAITADILSNFTDVSEVAL